MDVWDKSPLPPPLPPSPPEPRTGSNDGDDDDPPPPEHPAPVPSRPWSRRLAGMPAWVLVAVPIVLIGGVTVLLLGRDREATDPVAVDRTTALAPRPTVDPLLPVVSNPRASAPPTSSSTGRVATATSPATTQFDAAGDTTGPATSAASGATASSATTTTPPATTITNTTNTTNTNTTNTNTTITPTTSGAAAPGGVVVSGSTTVTGSNGERLTVTPRRGACGSGPDCFIASFTIDGFRSRPTEFVCEFSSGRRDVYRFGGTSVDPACSSVDIPESFVIEVGDLRSDPVTIDRRD